MSCRFTWAVQYFVGAGFYVIPTYSPADFSVDNTIVSTPALFLRNWANLWTAITEVWRLPYLQLWSGPFLMAMLRTIWQHSSSGMCALKKEAVCNCLICQGITVANESQAVIAAGMPSKLLNPKCCTVSASVWLLSWERMSSMWLMTLLGVNWQRSHRAAFCRSQLSTQH